MLDTQSRLRSRLASAGSLERTGRQQPQGIEGNLELARIAFLQEVAHCISSISMRSQVHTLTKTNTACRARHLSMVSSTSRLGAHQTSTLISAVSSHFLAMLEEESALARSQTSARDS